MKTKIIITIALLALNLNFALAGKSSNPKQGNPVEFKTDLSISMLAPVTPKEASFNDIVPEPTADVSIFAPSTPKEASFDDEVNPGTVICKNVLKNLAPVTPKEADFNNGSINPAADEDNLTVKPIKGAGK